MYIFIDTNTLLSFFGPKTSDKSLQELKKLLETSNGNLKFTYTEQVHNEFYKNIDSRVEKEKIKIKNISLDFQKKHLELLNDITKKQLEEKMADLTKTVESELAKRLERYRNDIHAREKLVSDLFRIGQQIFLTEDSLEKAQRRFVKGLPPKKSNGNSFGDGISWELLLKQEFDQEVIFITGDGDFTNKVDEKIVLNRYLKKEWESHHNVGIKVFPTLGGFINFFENGTKIDKKAIDNEYRSLQEALMTPSFVTVQEQMNTLQKHLNSFQLSTIALNQSITDNIDATMIDRLTSGATNAYSAIADTSQSISDSLNNLATIKIDIPDK